MPSNVTILYRGPLSSCNYDCSYCPFAKRHETASELKTDQTSLERFVDWAERYTDGVLSVFFTPWGEALTRRWYQKACQRLSKMPHVRKVAAQTNLSWPTDWLDGCDTTKLGLWCTYHPSQTTRDHFLQQLTMLRSHGVSHSVGMVACPNDYAAIQDMRAAVPNNTYMWLNAFDPGDGSKYPYNANEMKFLTAIDPHFATNTFDHKSFGRPCQTGSDVYSINGNGDVRRCHFVDDHVGNIYSVDWHFPRVSANCPKQTCGCHIGYVHLPHLELQQVYGEGLLERVPQRLPRSPDFIPIPNSTATENLS